MREMKNWLSRLGLLVAAGFFFFLCLGSLQIAMNCISLIEIFGKFWAVSILTSSIIAIIIFVVIVFASLVIFGSSFTDSKKDAKVSTTK